MRVGYQAEIARGVTCGGALGTQALAWSELQAL
jgi:hypothetical protein